MSVFRRACAPMAQSCFFVGDENTVDHAIIPCARRARWCMRNIAHPIAATRWWPEHGGKPPVCDFHSVLMMQSGPWQRDAKPPPDDAAALLAHRGGAR